MKRSTQLARQVCSVLSSAELPAPPERPKTELPGVVLVMHFFQQIAVSSCVSGRWDGGLACFSWGLVWFVVGGCLWGWGSGWV